MGFSRSDEIAHRLEAANLAVGRLDGVADLLPDVDLFIYFHVRKEAVLSSQIEGTQSTLTDLLLHEQGEAGQAGEEDVAEVVYYVAAMTHGLKRMATLPLSGRLLREMHEILLRNGRGAGKSPGEFRSMQNWIGGSRPGNAAYVPPPADMVAECMDRLGRFLHDDPVATSPFLKAALAHVQFESIHPFQDGNGRLGRLLVTLILCAEGVLGKPLLYLSLYLKRRREDYYDLLQRVRREGAWAEWVAFFLDGVIETARQSTAAARALNDVFAEDRRRVAELGAGAGTALRLHEAMRRRPIMTPAGVGRELGVSRPTAIAALKRLEALSLLRASPPTARGTRIYRYERCLRILEEGATDAG